MSIYIVLIDGKRNLFFRLFRMEKGHFCKCYGNNGGFTFLDSKGGPIAMLETTL